MLRTSLPIQAPVMEQATTGIQLTPALVDVLLGSVINSRSEEMWTIFTTPLLFRSHTDALENKMELWLFLYKHFTISSQEKFLWRFVRISKNCITKTTDFQNLIINLWDHLDVVLCLTRAKIPRGFLIYRAGKNGMNGLKCHFCCYCRSINLMAAVNCKHSYKVWCTGYLLDRSLLISGQWQLLKHIRETAWWNCSWTATTYMR